MSERQIPIYFDSVIVSSPLQEISDTAANIGRLKVRVFTKYGNRNGSYITEEVANQLIESAISGHTPVVGFFDPESQSWASHTGPTLANAYGYVENFLGWEPYEDTDGVTREYAVFSVILFTKYFEEAKKIIGQNQSMELDINSINGDWAEINGEEYFVYTTAKMLGFCVIGAHEPCFSVSAFFSKNDNDYATQYDKFSSLLSDLKAQVEEAEKNMKGGEQPMNEFEVNVEQAEAAPEVTPVVEEPVVEEPAAEPEVNFEASEETETVVEEPAAEEPAVEEPAQPSEFEVLQNKYNTLTSEYEAATARIQELETQNAQISELQATIEELNKTIANYEEQRQAAEKIKKVDLIEKYEKIIDDAEEIESIRGQMDNFTLEDLNSKLAVIFANKQLNAVAEEEEEKVPLVQPQEQSQFALLMQKYRK